MELPKEFVAKVPHYQCHKIVQALKIKSVTKHQNRDIVIGHGPATYELEFDRKLPSVFVDEPWMKRSHCKSGGYLVIYEDGYVSWSPAKAFEEGYTRISSKDDPLTPEELNRVAENATLGHELKYPATH